LQAEALRNNKAKDRVNNRSFIALMMTREFEKKKKARS